MRGLWVTFVRSVRIPEILAPAHPDILVGAARPAHRASAYGSTFHDHACTTNDHTRQFIQRAAV